MSRKFGVMRGAVQGSVLGVMDHNAVTETIDDSIPLCTEKYVDDMTMVENLPKARNCMRARGCENSLKELDSVCSERNLKINNKKTQLLTVSGKPPQ